MTSKRIFDVVVSAAALLFLSPLLLGLALVIRLKLGSPIIFSQTRPGRRGRPFSLLKFRTMSTVTDVNGRLLPDGQRLTPLGSMLRKASLDELPELLNIFCGDMSLVGPRPLLMEYLGLYSSEQARRLEVRPGLTGWAQVNGRNAVSWEERFALDVWYVDHMSFILDLKILWLTVLTVLGRKGVSQPGHATMERFKGTPR
jgi:sugar transferase EpsL